MNHAKLKGRAENPQEGNAFADDRVCSMPLCIGLVLWLLLQSAKVGILYEPAPGWPPKLLPKVSSGSSLALVLLRAELVL
eukprot:6445627-Amphidinium_carterae.2